MIPISVPDAVVEDSSILTDDPISDYDYGTTTYVYLPPRDQVFYSLQVSAVPATATFPNDVSTTHPFFRHIEALAASGVAAGCGTAGSYYPGQGMRRAQMAVFLAIALGLHFPD